MLNLTPDELLTTTRAVRKRLDLTRPVEREIIQECISIAQQAPTGSNLQAWRFLVITDPDKRGAIGALFQRAAKAYLARAKSGERIKESVSFLSDHISEVPVHVIPCITRRPEGMSFASQAALWCSVIPAAWSFMLAARARGLGSTFTSFHLSYEEEAAKILGIPYKEVMQAALLPVAYTKGTDFKPARRKPLSTMVYWDTWGSS